MKSSVKSYSAAVVLALLTAGTCVAQNTERGFKAVDGVPLKVEQGKSDANSGAQEKRPQNDREAQTKKSEQERQVTNKAKERQDRSAQPRQSDPASDKQREAERELAKQKAEQQRKEALGKGGASAITRNRMEEASKKVDPAKINEKDLTVRREKMSSEMNEAMARLKTNSERLNNRMIQLKQEIREREAAQADQMELKELYAKADRLAQLKNELDGELNFLLGMTTKIEGPKTKEEKANSN